MTAISTPTSVVPPTTTGCWQSFVSGVQTVGKTAWDGMSKAAAWAATFFAALGSQIMLFAKTYAREIALVGAGFGAGILIALICNQCLGCCQNSDAASTGTAPNTNRA